MSSLSRLALPLLASLLFTGPILAADPTPAEKEVLARVNELLTRYEANDQAAVVAMLDNPVTILGSDFREAARSPVELKELMSRDFGQWGQAKFSDLRDLDIRVSETLATAFFTFTFSAQNGPSIPVRTCSTWRKVDGKWLLTQSASAVPPQG
jgi:hypothetical protein